MQDWDNNQKTAVPDLLFKPQAADPSRLTNQKIESFVVTASEDGRSLMRVLLDRFPELRLSDVRSMLRRRDLRVDGRRLRSDARVYAGQTVLVYASESSHNSAAPPDVDRQIKIIDADANLLVIRKEPGISVESHAVGSAVAGLTLIDILRRRLDEPGLRLVHRLDRQTGGLLMVARNSVSAALIEQLLRDRVILKRYRALVLGLPSQGEPVRCADGTAMCEVRAWLEKDARRAEVFVRDDRRAGDRQIITRYRLLRDWIIPNMSGDAFKPTGTGIADCTVSELEIELVTGRTHQIRAHFAHLGHPLLGDGKYGRFSRGPLPDEIRRLRRQQLWACQIIFPNPCPIPLQAWSGKSLSIDPQFDWQPPVREVPFEAGETNARI